MSYYCGVTFLCWLFGGWFGLHHFYLGRDGHGFLWATSGGGFLIGWLREFRLLSSYTDDANKTYPLNRSTSLLRNFTRLWGMLVFGIFYRRIFLNAIPDELPEFWYTALVMVFAPLGTALAVHIISNVGHIKCKVWYPLIGAYVGEVLFGYLHILWADPNVLLLLACTVVPSVYHWKERKKRVKQHFCWRLVLWGGLAVLFSTMWLAYIYCNVEVYVDELEKDVKLRNILKDIFDSPEWKELMSEVKNLLRTLWDTSGDYEKTWFLFQEGVASSRISKALETLEFDRGIRLEEEVTQTVLSKRCRDMSRKWHPDKHPLGEKDEAQTMFIEVQSACETLKTVITRRSKRKIEL